MQKYASNTLDNGGLIYICIYMLTILLSEDGIY